MRTLLPAELGPHLLDTPLPHDLYNQQGVLVLRGGEVITDPDRLAQLAAMRLLRRQQQEDDWQAPPYAVLTHLAHQCQGLLEQPGGLDIGALDALATVLQRLVHDHPDLSAGMASQLGLPNLALRHVLQAAVTALLLARELGLTPASERTLARAALTMNLASLPLQDALARGLTAPAAAQRARLRLHPWHAAEVLAQRGVNDAAWLLAVSQHHENLDGSGYPFGIRGSAITPEARILRVADVWCALLGQRYSRTARDPRQALRLLFRRERRRLDPACLLALRRVVGYFPPGTLVRLANRETALVTRRFPRLRQPAQVISLLRPTGHPVARHLPRDTSRAEFLIRDYTYLPLFSDPGLDWAQVWQAGA